MLIALAVLVLLPAAGLAAFLLTFDPDAQKPRIEAAVRAATGRDLTIAGPIGVKPALRPTITLRDVALANPPGFSRPALLTLRHAEVRLAVLPLLFRRVELDRVTLDGADLLLERDAAGRPNWVFERPQASAPTAQPAPRPTGPAARPPEIVFDEVLLTGSRIGWKAGPAAARELAVTRLALAPRGADRVLRVEGAVVLDGLPLTLEGESGPAAALLAGDPAPWPLRLALAGEAGLALGIEGSLTPPTGYRLAVTARVPELARLAPLLPDAPLPPLRGVEAAAVLTGREGGPPAVSGLRLVLGESPLNAVLSGLVLDRAVLTLAAADQPLGLEIAARIGALPVTLAGTLGAPLALLGPGGPPWPVELQATAGAARLALAGTVADPRAGTGIDLGLT
ncbi:MAG: AsmA family protein, partial [Acetobacteraceae bacterium]|nr:AsmA family protein [Acetobacteraceae bacterium]